MRIRLSEETCSTADAWRMRLIRFSMWGPMADVSGWTLETLGDNEGARTALFFSHADGAVVERVLPLPGGNRGAAQERQKAIDKVLGLIESRRKQGFLVSLKPPRPGSNRTTTGECTGKSKQHPCSACSTVLMSLDPRPAAIFYTWPSRAESAERHVAVTPPSWLMASDMSFPYDSLIYAR